jgi:5-methylcytosine-specific restriction endonuclease McrBC regulatory subunit McrC
MEEVKYGESEDDIYGILFDGAWLWEEYVNTILEEYGFIHPRNKQGEGRIYLFDDRTGVRYPDFYKDDIVLDAKYKRLDSYEKVSRVNRDDVHQVIAYMNNRKASKGGFIAPLNQRQETIPTSRLRDSLATMSIFGIEISKNSSSYADFCDEMKKMEAAFINSLDL